MTRDVNTSIDDDDWSGILAKDEEIIWQGRPEPGFQLDWSSPFSPLVAIFFTGFSIFWMVKASEAGGFFWTFGLLFFFIGLFQLFGVHFWKAFVRARSFYSVSTQRAYIATDLPFAGRQLKSYVISNATPLDLVAKGAFGSVYFATETWRDSDGDRQSRKIGFERLANAREAYEALSQAQGNAQP